LALPPEASGPNEAGIAIIISGLKESIIPLVNPLAEIILLRKFWLVFAQACTLCLAALFVVSTLRPDLLPRLTSHTGNVVVLQETSTPVAEAKVASYADAAKRAMPAVVNIYTSKEMRQRSSLLDDPLLRRYFPDLAERCRGSARQASVPASSCPTKVTCSPITT
jgi:S1-C subfamily serine protease